MLNPREAAKLYKVSPQTLKLWANQGLIKFEKTQKGHRRYAPPEVIDQQTTEPDASCRNWIYCRVSSYKQKEDLNRQVAFLKEKYPFYGVISDIGSGANFHRTGLKRLLARIDSGAVDKLVVAHKDRLARVGYPVIEYLIKRRGVTLTVLNSDEGKSSEEEAAEELIAIITYYTAKMHGKRKYAKTGGSVCHEKDKVLSHQVSETKLARILGDFTLLLQQSFSMGERQENPDARALEEQNELLLSQGK